MATPDKLDLMLSPEAHAPDLEGYGRAQRLWRSLPIPRFARLAVGRVLYRLSPRARLAAEAQATLDDLADLPPRPPGEIPPGRLVVSGLFNDVSGIARGGRMSLAAFRAAGLAPVVHDWRAEPDGWGEAPDGGVWFGHFNAPEGRGFLLASKSPRRCYRVGYWAWELPDLPEAWVQTAGLYHEIWAPSAFTADAIRRGVDHMGVVVRRVPHPLPDVTGVTADRARFGLEAGVFNFLAMYDVFSSATRKNPIGAVTAFQRAFPPGRGDVALVLKVVAPVGDPACLADLRAATEGWPNIRLIVERLSDAEIDTLVASSDAFVSLHRSEGFGLSIAHAMALGRPAVVTGWSGNVDFCGEGAIQVGYRLIPVDDPTGVYVAPGQVWADPDLDEAAAAMRRLADDPAASRALGALAKAHVEAVLPRAYDVATLKPWLA